MSKMALMAAVVLPFVMRRKPVAPEPASQPEQQSATVVPLKSARDSVAEFLDETIEFYGPARGKEAVRFVRLRESYRTMREARGWPTLSDRALSTLLCELGCERRQVDLRARGEGRPTFFDLPHEVDREAA